MNSVTSQLDEILAILLKSTFIRIVYIALLAILGTPWINKYNSEVNSLQYPYCKFGDLEGNIACIFSSGYILTGCLVILFLLITSVIAVYKALYISVKIAYSNVIPIIPKGMINTTLLKYAVLNPIVTTKAFLYNSRTYNRSIRRGNHYMLLVGLSLLLVAEIFSFWNVPNSAQLFENFETNSSVFHIFLHMSLIISVVFTIIKSYFHLAGSILSFINLLYAVFVFGYLAHIWKSIAFLLPPHLNDDYLHLVTNYTVIIVAIVTILKIIVFNAATVWDTARDLHDLIYKN